MKNPLFSHILFIVMVILLGACAGQRSMRSGQVSYEIGEHFNAIEKYRKAYRSQKTGGDKAVLAFRIAESYYKISEFAKASVWYKNAIKRNYDEPIGLLHFADCLRATQKYDEAITWYQTYLGVRPDDQYAINGLESSKIVKEWLDNPNRYIVGIVKELNSKGSDYSPVFVGGRDNEIIFTSSRDGATGGKRTSNITGTHFSDLFTSQFQVQKQKWDTPKLIDENEMINTASDEGAATLSSRGDQIIFTRCVFDKTKDKGAELYAANQSRGEWSEPTLIELVGDSLIAAQPSLSADGTKLYFVSDRVGGYGGKDIWVATEKGGGAFESPENLGPAINTPGDEMFPTIRENGELYFSSNYLPGIGGLDIFKAVRDDNNKWMVENLKAPINSPGDDFGMTFINGEVVKGLFASNRKGSRSDDIYSFYLPPKVFNVTGEIENRETAQKIDGALIRIIGTDGTNLKMRADGGRFQLKLKPETEYVIAAFKDGFLNDKALASTIGLEDSKEFRFQFKLAPTDEPIKVNNINYAFGSYEITEESKVALDSVVHLLTLNPTIIIELMAHTDHVGSNDFNSELSQKRAQSVVDYMISKGINAARLVAKGYGETWPKRITREIARQYDFLKRNDELTEELIMKLTPEQQEIAKGLNRRTEFRVLSNDFHE